MSREPAATDTVLLLRRRPFRDRGDLLEGLSGNAGRVAGVMSRSKKLSLDPPVLVCLQRRGGATLGVFSQPVVQSAYSGLRRNLDSLLAAGFLARLFLASLPENEPNEQAFELLCELYEALSSGKDARIGGLWGQKRLLDCLGLAPQLESCVECGREAIVGFSATAGGVLCGVCFGGSGFLVAESELTLIRLLNSLTLRDFTVAMLEPEGVRMAGRIFKAQFQTHLELSSDYFKRVLPQEK